jgi:hypothetical protein
VRRGLSARHVPVVGGDDAANAASAAPVRLDPQPGRVHAGDEVIADGVGDGFVEDALVAETLEVHLQALELDADAAVAVRTRAEPHDDFAEVRVPGLGAEARELFGDVLDDERCIRGGRERFEEARVWHTGW